MKTPSRVVAVQERSTYHGLCKRHLNGSRPDLKAPYREVSLSSKRYSDRSLPKGRYFISAFRLDRNIQVSTAGSRLAEFYNLLAFLKQSISSCCENNGAQIAVCQSRTTSKRGLVYDVPDFGSRKSEYRRLGPGRSPTQEAMQ